VCVDEADVLLTGSEQQATWQILDHIRNTTQSSYIFTAATLPSGGKQTVHSRLMKWLPKNTSYVTTERTHKLISTAEHKFVDIEVSQTSDLKLQAKRLRKAKEEQLIHDLSGLDSKSKVLLFCNSVSSAEILYRFLCDLSKVSPAQWWFNAVGQLYRWDGASTADLEDSLSKFHSSNTRVLVCTDLGCRGLDLRDVNKVIHFDFPGNVADFIHRSGRTARAGNYGHVISYVDQDGRELASVIEEACSQGERMDGLFSRNKMLRRKLKQRY